jgi:uncharacterized membrane protein
MRTVAAFLIFAYLTLEVRHVFRGYYIQFTAPPSAAEQWTYSAVWLSVGLVLLVYGIWREDYEARLASAFLVILSILKVFILDLQGLTGFWRAFSFIVLGLVLIGIGIVYQNLFFRRPQHASISNGNGSVHGSGSNELG